MPMPVRFDGRVAVVTGAGRGIGRAHARLLAGRGAAVVVNDVGFVCAEGGDISSGPACDVVAEITASGGKAVANSDDVSSPTGAGRLVEQALDSFGGKLDIVINNAGIAKPVSFLDMTTDQFEFMLKVHLHGTFHVTKAAWPHMMEAGYGRVILTSSCAGMFGVANNAHYCAAKGAVYGMVRGLAIEGASLGIHVNGFCPSAYTRMVGGDSFLRERMEATMPADLVSPVAVWLAHERCSLSGEVLHGGSGRASRVLVAETRGYVDHNLTLEDMEQNEEAILDEAGYFVFRSGLESSQMQTALVEGQ